MASTPSAAPYWGNLDPPIAAVSRQESLRRRNNDDRGNDQNSAQYPPTQARANRISTQSQAPTISTQSSYPSPTTPTFKADGLGPRPSSFSYGASEGYTRDFIEKRKRRASRDVEDYYRDIGSTAPPPVVPDAPRPPPLSYKQPYPSSAPSTNNSNLARSGSARRRDVPVNAKQGVTQESSQDGRPEARTSRQLNMNPEYRKERSSISEEIDRPRNHPDMSVIRRGTVDARKERPEYHDSAAQSPRKESIGDTEAQRRREWAPDRSPLQRLELTLDSITKEEKRARVEEAELLAREAKAGRGGERLNQNSVRFRNRPASKAAEPTTQPEPQSLPEAGLVRSLSTKQKEELRRSGTIEMKKPAETESAKIRPLDKGFEYAPQQDTLTTTRNPARSSVPQRELSPRELETTSLPQRGASFRDAEKSSVPQRGPSFRERAGVPATVAAAVAGATVGAAAGPASAASLSRSTSNRLKKEPPGDPWYQRRLEAERKYQEVSPRRISIDARPDRAEATASSARAAGGPLGSAPVDTRDPQAIPRNGETKESLVNPQADAAALDSDEEYLYPPRVHRGSASKIQQLTGSKPESAPLNRMLPQQQQLYADKLDRSEELGPGNVESKNIKTVNGIKYAVSPETAAGNFGQENASRGPDGHHHFSNISHFGHRRRSQYSPGEGLYAPKSSLDEWKKASTAVLSGPLLDLSVRQMEAEKDKAWWDAGNSGRRRSSTRQRKVETFDGEHESINGMTLSKFPNSTDEIEAFFAQRGATRTWSRIEDLVVPRARKTLAYKQVEPTKARIRVRNKVWWRKPNARPLPTGNSSANMHLISPIFSPYSSDCSKKSKHNLFHPFHVCITPNPLIKKLTRTMRLIRVAATAPTVFKPQLHLKCGPLLRYCGIRRTTAPPRSGNSTSADVEMWRGSIMIVTDDTKSSYDVAPILRIFAQPIELLPPPLQQLDGEASELAPEYVDPISGLPKIGRDGRTLYVRPVEQLEEETDLSNIEDDEGIFESQRSTIDSQPASHDGTADPKGSFAGRSQRIKVDGEKLLKYIEIRGFRLHAEQDVTFWRFNIEIELGKDQQRIAYRINRGPATGFWVPARGQSMNMMFHSCNGFSLSVNPDQFSGPDPMWRDVLNTHQTQPFHVMIGGGDQIYNDSVMQKTDLFAKWLSIRNPLEKHNAPFTAQMQAELEQFYLERYSMWFSQGLFGLANSLIPMINVYDDHDIIDGFGSYPDSFMRTPVFSGLGAVAFKYYMLFQHQSIIDEGEDAEPSWILGARPGPYIKELSRSVFMSLGSSIAFLGMDCRTERTQDDIVTDETYEKVFTRVSQELIKGETKHLIVLLGVPIAYPRLVWLENILTSRLMDPIKALGKTNIFGNFIGHIDGGVEVLDDLNDHWTAKNHKAERRNLIEDLQELAAEKSVRITILGGDVHLAAIGQFYSNTKLGIPKDKDFRYMPNVISSAIVNTPPPNALADILNKRERVHHFDEDTDESMIPLFDHDVNGAKRNNKRLLPRRNWCSIREYNPTLTPPPTPPDDRSPSPPPRRTSLLRRLSISRGPSYRPDAGPPLSGGLLKTFSVRGRASTDLERPGIRQRAMSLTRGDFLPANLFRRGSKRRPDDGGINGYGADSDDDDVPDRGMNPPRLRGGAGDDGYFPPDAAAPFTRTRVGRNAVIQGHDDGYASYDDESPDQLTQSHHRSAPILEPARRPFHRTPTGLTERQMRKLGADHEVNLEGGLDICLNVEISQKDPAGSTETYRLLVPALWYDGNESIQGPVEKRESGLKRLMSLRRTKTERPAWKGKGRDEGYDDEDYDSR